jgi:hypothetical protein
VKLSSNEIRSLNRRHHHDVCVGDHQASILAARLAQFEDNGAVIEAAV